jgi:hypothetical protein
MNMSNEQIKHAANSIIAMRNKPKPEIDRIDKQLERKELKDSKYARRVEIDALVSKLADDREIEQDSL